LELVPDGAAIEPEGCEEGPTPAEAGPQADVNTTPSAAQAVQAKALPDLACLILMGRA